MTFVSCGEGDAIAIAIDRAVGVFVVDVVFVVVAAAAAADAADEIDDDAGHRDEKKIPERKPTGCWKRKRLTKEEEGRGYKDLHCRCR